MSDNKEEWEIGYSRENPAEPQEDLKTVSFAKTDALVGQLLDGRFLIEKDLTESGADAGGIGLVYLAKDLKLMSREVVVKILQKAMLVSEDIARKFLHEKEALIRMDHPNIVRILDSGALSDGNPFMVMEFIEGHSLRHKLREHGKLSFDETAHIVEGVTEALNAAHSKQVLHRDIKPENIMLTPQEDGFERVRLIDFGIARVENAKLAPATEIPRGIGTILYIAPEQLAGDLVQTPAVDIYSFAIVVYEMLTGELPFRPQSLVSMFELQKEGVRTLPGQLRTDLPKAAERLLLSALEFESGKRPQNVRKFGRDLAVALRGTADHRSFDTTPELAETLPAFRPNSFGAESLPTAPRVADKKSDFPNIVVPLPERKQRTSKPVIWAALGLLILAAISIAVGLFIWTNSGKPVVETPANTAADKEGGTNSLPESTETAPMRELSYFLNVQKMRDGKPFEEPFKSSGQEIFENGYKFTVNLQSDADGYYYLFNEDKDAHGNTVYNILYPTPKTNGGSAEIKAKENVETSQNTFSGERGTEKLWLIWTAEKQDDLEAARKSAFTAKGAVSDSGDVQKLTRFLEKYKDDKNELTKDTSNRQSIVKARGNTVVHRLELEHR